MIWFALWLRLRTFLGSAWAWMARNPLLALIAALAAFSAYSWHGWSRERERFATYRAAGVEAAKQQAELRAAEKQAYKDKAHEADLSYSRKLADARSSTAAYIASRRVQPPRVSPAKPVSEAGAAGVRQEVPRGLVMVDEADVQRAAEWQAYALELREWAVSVAQ